MASPDCPCRADFLKNANTGYTTAEYGVVGDEPTPFGRTVTLACARCRTVYEVDVDETPAAHAEYHWRPGTLIGPLDEGLANEFWLVRWAVSRFGSATDAENHGQGIASPGLVAEGDEALRLVFGRTPVLREAMPRTWHMVEVGKSLADEGYAILAETAAAERRLARKRVAE
jgi:hypothetical protein